MKDADRKNALHEIPIVIARGHGLSNAYAHILLGENATLRASLKEAREVIEEYRTAVAVHLAARKEHGTSGFEAVSIRAAIAVGAIERPSPQATPSEHYGKCPCGHAYSAHMGGGQCLIPGCGCGAYAGPETQATPKPKPEDKFAFTLRVGDENFKKLSPDLQEQIRAMLAGYPNPPKPQAAPKRCLSCESVFGVEVHHINPCERGKATTGKECANPWCSKSVPCVKCEKPNGQESR